MVAVSGPSSSSSKPQSIQSPATCSSTALMDRSAFGRDRAARAMITASRRRSWPRSRVAPRNVASPGPAGSPRVRLLPRRRRSAGRRCSRAGCNGSTPLRSLHDLHSFAVVINEDVPRRAVTPHFHLAVPVWKAHCSGCKGGAVYFPSMGIDCAAKSASCFS
jgi:hypothetical protein